jgi:Na+-driven multidrug efflux pump
VSFAPTWLPQGSCSPVLRQTMQQLEEYFAGTRRDFDLPIFPYGTPFQQRVWQQLRRIPYIRLKRKSWRPDLPMLAELTRFGIPIALLYIMIAAGGIALQSAVNRQGSLFVAGFTATNKLYGLLECAAISLGLALATFTAQNYGAGDGKRVREGVRVGLFISIAASFAVTAVSVPCGRWMLQAFIDPAVADGPEALAIGERYLFIMVLMLSILFPIHVYRNALQALGDSFWPMISGAAETLLRIAVGFAIIAFSVPQLLFYAEPAAWIFALTFSAVPYYRRLRRTEFRGR